MGIFGLGTTEVIVIALVLLLFFGKDRLPGLFRSIGSSVRELKTSLSEDAPATPTVAEQTPAATPAATTATEQKEAAPAKQEA